MAMDDFQLCKDDNGVEFVQYTEGQTKTRQGGLHTKTRDFQPRMFAVGGERCPVALFKQFVSRRPQNLKTTGAFYLSIKTNRKPDDNLWFKAQAMGVNKINAMMKGIVEDTILESTDKKFTNHSARKTVVSKLKKANIERSGIAKVTGHRNIQSLDDYDEANEDEQRQLSYAISGRNNLNPQPTTCTTTSTEVGQQQSLVSSAQPPRARMPLMPISMPGSSTFGVNQSSASLNPTMMRAQEQNLLNTFNYCQVSFNFKSSKTPRPVNPSVKPIKRRRCHIIESDSDSD